MCQRLPREDLNFTTPFDQLTQIILFDLVNLAVPVFEKVRLMFHRSINANHLSLFEL